MINKLFYCLLTTGFLFHPFIVNYDDLSLKKCNNEDWTIHGFWPETSHTSWPQFCNHSRYNLFNETQLLQKLGDRLKKSWLPCPEWNLNPDKFWRHEWMKHGTCTIDTPLEYFNGTLNIFENAKSQSWFGCCNDEKEKQCLLHFNKTTNQWLGFC